MNEIQKIAIDELHATHQSHKLNLRIETTKDRIAKLKKFRSSLLKHRKRIQDAVYADFQKHASEVDITEIYVVVNELNHAIRNLKDWMRPQRVKTPLNMLGTSGAIQHEPKGSTLIIAPWNFPINLSLGPLVSAVAAGNTVILKPSELTPFTSALIEKIVEEVFEKEQVGVVNGGVEVSSYLLSLRFDHIFFTGSPRVGKIVMKAAAKHLTSVTLELGGKSPTIVDKGMHLETAAKRIAWGKWMNNGQTCIAPDYVFVHRSELDRFVQLLEKNLQKFYGKMPEQSDSYARIVNTDHTKRLEKIIAEQSPEKIKGGYMRIDERYISPTVIVMPELDANVMQQEIFGPILPVLAYDDLDECIQWINSNEKPLTLYVYANRNSIIQRILHETSSGGAVINDSVLHFMHSELPFGGVNNSGIGKSHGFYGFQAFSNAKGVLRQHLKNSPLAWLYPPYTQKTQRLVDLLIRYF